MRLLRWYVCRAFVRFFCLSVALFGALVFLIELSDRVDNFINRQVEVGDAVLYMALRVPGTLYYTVPAACLLASVLTFSTLHRHNEIIAIRAGGISPFRLARTLWVLGALAGLLLLFAQEYLLPYTNQAHRQIWRTRVRHVKRDIRSGVFKQGHIWYRAGPRIWSVGSSKPLDNRLFRVTIYDMDPRLGIRRRYDAAEAVWGPQGWILRHGTLRTFDAAGGFAGPPESFTARHVAFPERPADISAVRKELDEMGIREIWAYAQQLRRHGVPATRYLVEFHGKVAFSAVCIVMAGLGVPLALRSNRQGGMLGAIALTLIGGFSYWGMHSIAMAFGHNGQLPPVVAAWAGNVCFGCGSLYLATRLE